MSTEKQKAKLEDLFKTPEHGLVKLVWSVNQRIVDAYRQPKPDVGTWVHSRLIDEIGVKLLAGFPELKRR